MLFFRNFKTESIRKAYLFFKFQHNFSGLSATLKRYISSSDCSGGTWLWIGSCAFFGDSKLVTMKQRVPTFMSRIVWTELGNLPNQTNQIYGTTFLQMYNPADGATRSIPSENVQNNLWLIRASSNFFDHLCYHILTRKINPWRLL